MDLIRDFDYIPTESIDRVEDVAMRGGSVRLYNPMRLQFSDAGHEVYSPSPMTIGHVTIWSASPIRIIRHALPGRSILIEPAASLGTAFANGWRKLPLELKEQILAHNLVSANSKAHIEYDTYCAPWDIGILLHHLRCTPEIASLSRDLYYRHNIFRLEPDEIMGSYRLPYKLVYPRPAVGNLIHSIEFRCKLGTRGFEMLVRLSRNGYGFPNLKYLKLIFDASPCLGNDRVNFRRWLDMEIVDGIDFPCKGEMEVVGHVTSRIVQDGRSQTFKYLPSEDAHHLQVIDSILRPMVNFGCNEHEQNRR